ncbi:MAG: molybdopterin-dependent oxidoreductase, partial [Acidobacteria bacterium]|nr:molybdopterin-dependent oxidoreductase [Acidobacteriota bacterium]
MSKERFSHYRTCNLCEAMCGVAIEVEGNEIRSIKGDAEDPFSQGHICPKALGLKDVYEDPDRLKQPIRRTSSGWEPIGWKKALDLVGSRLKEAQERHGPAAVGVYAGNPNVHNLGSQLLLPTFLRAIRTPNFFSASSVDQLPSHFASLQMFGHYFRIPVPDVDRTDFFLILGANPLASNGSLMTAGGIDRRLKALQARGGKIVVVDPRRTETARKADRHLFIPPGKDVLLLLALLSTLFEEKLVKPGPLAEFTAGLDHLGELSAEFTAERVAPSLKLPALEIRGLAREFAAAPTAVCYGRMGLSTQAFGGLCQWLINALNLVTGNLDRPGGAMFPRPAFDIVIGARKGKTGRWKSRVRGLPEFTGELPAACLSEEIATPGEGQIRALLTIAGNPVLSTPGGGQLDRLLPQLDFMAAIDIYVNETTRHADVILPPTTGLETDHYDIAFHTLAVRNSAKYSPALFPPGEDRLHDWQIYRELAWRLTTDGAPFDPEHPMNR